MNNLKVTEPYKTISDFYVGMTLPEKIAVLYARLSQDDKNKNKGDDSDSIVNQKAILAKFATDNRLANPVFFTDDGISGTTFDRPDFQSALELVEAGRVTNFVVKDAYVKLRIIFLEKFYKYDKNPTKISLIFVQLT